MTTTLDDEISKEIKVLPVGDGPVRISVSMGATFVVGSSGTYIKPNWGIEVSKPADIELDEYIKLLNTYAEIKFLGLIEQMKDSLGL